MSLSDVDFSIFQFCLRAAVGLVGCVGSNPKFARGCLIGSSKVQEMVMGKDWNARVSETMKG
jgi:hypothetical protein